MDEFWADEREKFIQNMDEKGRRLLPSRPRILLSWSALCPCAHFVECCCSCCCCCCCCWRFVDIFSGDLCCCCFSFFRRVFFPISPFIFGTFSSVILEFFLVLRRLYLWRKETREGGRKEGGFWCSRRLFWGFPEVWIWLSWGEDVRAVRTENLVTCCCWWWGGLDNLSWRDQEISWQPCILSRYALFAAW